MMMTSRTMPTPPSTMPAIAIPPPPCAPPDRWICDRATRPKIRASTANRRPTSTTTAGMPMMPRTSAATAKPLVEARYGDAGACAPGPGVDELGVPQPEPDPPGGLDHTALAASGGGGTPGLASGGYHLPSDACHHPDPCAVSLIAAPPPVVLVTTVTNGITACRSHRGLGVSRPGNRGSSSGSRRA